MTLHEFNKMPLSEVKKLLTEEFGLFLEDANRRTSYDTPDDVEPFTDAGKALMSLEDSMGVILHGDAGWECEDERPDAKPPA